MGTLARWSVDTIAKALNQKSPREALARGALKHWHGVSLIMRSSSTLHPARFPGAVPPPRILPASISSAATPAAHQPLDMALNVASSRRKFTFVESFDNIVSMSCRP